MFFKKQELLIPAQILNPDQKEHLELAAQILKKGGLVAFPTETVYGLGADAFKAESVAKIFEVKKRPSFDPLIVHISKKEDLKRLWKEIPALAEKLIEKFWPGPLTIVAEKNESVPDIVTAGLSTVGVRMPASLAALNLISQAASPIAAPSANLYGYTSPTTAQAVLDDLGSSIDAVLDAGPTKIGIESTVIKLEGNEIVLLRPGGVSVEELKKIAPVKLPSISEAGGAYESPGQTESHYAPWTPLLLLPGSFKESLPGLEKWSISLSKQGKLWPRIGLLSLGVQKNMPLLEVVEVLSPSESLYEAAANLFQAIRKLDKMNLDLILAEPVSTKGIGLGIMDRLKKASKKEHSLKAYFENIQDKNE